MEVSCSGSFLNIVLCPISSILVDGRLWDEFCGLSSLIPFNGTVYGESCSGTVSDWDDDGCVIRGNLALRSNTCRNLQPPMGKYAIGTTSVKAVESDREGLL